MIKREDKFGIGLGVVLAVIGILSSILSYLYSYKKAVFFSLLYTACIPVPFLILFFSRRKRIMMPPSFLIISLCFIFLAQYLGEALRFYKRFGWWDLLLHAIFGGYAVIVGIHSVKGLIVKEEQTTQKRFFLFVAVYSFCLSTTLSCIWEMFEYVADYLLKTNMTKSGFQDTMTDLLISTAAAVVIVVVYCYKKKGVDSEKKVIHSR